MPFPNEVHETKSFNNLILKELAYNGITLVNEHQNLLSTMTIEQKDVYNKIISIVSNNQDGIFFMYGYRGFGKTIL